MLYGFPVEAVKEQFAKLVHNSIEYMVFKKCGLPTDVFEEGFFENINHFNSMWLFTRMGSIFMPIARPILREIHMEIENIKHERSKDNEPETFDRPDLLRGRGRTTISKYPNIGGRAEVGKFGKMWKEYMEEQHPFRITELIMEAGTLI